LRITEANAATICGWWADNIGLNDSFERIAHFIYALVLEIVGDVNRCVDTFSSLDVARVSSAQVVVITVDRSVDTSSGISVARVHCARIQIITQFWQVLAESSGRNTNVNSTGVTIIARFFRESDTSSNCLIASGRSAFVGLVAVKRSEHTSSLWVASVNSALNSIIANSRSLDELTRKTIASVSVAFVIAIHFSEIKLRHVLATSGNIARINCARIVVIAADGDVFACFGINIASVKGTSIVVVAVLSLVNTFSSCLITRINCARISIIADSWNGLYSMHNIA
jgi:hypothetical protein